MEIVIVTVSDRASRGEYEDLSGPLIEDWLKKTVTSSYKLTKKVIPDGFQSVRDTLIDFCDQDRVDLILTTGGTGPAPRDETPEAMRAVMIKELPGFGELLGSVRNFVYGRAVEHPLLRPCGLKAVREEN